MIETEIHNPELASLRKQIKLLSIILFGLGVLVCVLITESFRRQSASGSDWPNISAGVLQVRKIVVMTDDGKPAAILSTINGSSGLAMLDTKGEVRILLTTSDNKGLMSLSAENADQSMNISNDTLLVGNEKIGGLMVEGSSTAGPMIKVFDSSGYSAQLGRSYVINHTDGTVSMTSAATVTGSSKDRASTWSLLSQPALSPPPASEQNPQRRPSFPQAPPSDINR